MFRRILVSLIMCSMVLHIQAQDIDIFTPTMITIKENYIQQKKQLDEARKTELTNLIDSCIIQAEKQEKEQKSRGNISAMAAAQKMSRILNKYKKELEEKDDFELSSKTRRETKSISDRMAKEKAIIDSKYKELDVETLITAQDKFKTEAMIQQSLPDIPQDKVESEFEKLTKTKTVAKIPSSEPAVSPNNSTKKTPVDSLFDDYLSSREKENVVQSGETEYWQSFASIKGAVNTIEIFDIPLAGISDSKIFQGMREGNAYKLEYTPLDKLNTENETFFMIKNLNSEEKFDIVNWPSKRNDWTLSLRLRPSKTFPSNHRLELKIGGEHLKTAEQKQKTETVKLKNVKIQVKSIPDNAYVLLDNKPLRIAGKFAVTPCIITIPSEQHTLTIKKSGFNNKVIENFIPEHRQSYSYVLIRSKNVNETTTKVDATSSWESSKLMVNKGDTIVFQTKGEWSIGKYKEQTDYKGYPNNSSFFKYYIEDKYHPSISTGELYGALIAKIGIKGTPFAITDKPIIADSTGIIYYTANELNNNKSDNIGFIYVKAQINLEQ